jgi:hypothetical protein
VLEGEGFEVLCGMAHQAQASNARALGESDVRPIGLEFPPALLLFHTTLVLLKFGIALLAGFLVRAILREARESGPGTMRTGLRSLGIEACGKRIRFRQNRTRALQSGLANRASIHPQAEALVADELHETDRLLQSKGLCAIPV